MEKTNAQHMNSGLTRGWYQFQERGVLLVLIGLVVVFSIATPNFRQMSNFINITRQICEISIAGIGMTYLLIAAEFDLSVGSLYGLAAVTGAVVLRSGLPIWLAVILPVLLVVFMGLVNGAITTKLNVPAFIVTISTMWIIRGMIYYISGAQAISIFPKSADPFFIIGDNVAEIIPIQIFIMIGLNIIAAIILTKTTFGFKVYATGGNKKAAQLTGINTDRIKIYCFIICGVASAISGLISLGYMQSVHPLAGGGREMDVIGAVIVGGTALFGGRGSILGTFLGAAIMGVVRNGMILLGIPAWGQEAFVGVVILVAVILDTWVKREKT
jgi:simple sugar transport system permease protein/ribose transport system permease protein